jgi:nucleotide sugar dehydrogenase
MSFSTKAVKALGRRIPFASRKKEEKRAKSISPSLLTTTRVSDSEASDEECTTVPKRGYKHVVQIGCGVVGSAYMKAFKSKGHTVTGIEASPRTINDLGSDFRMHHVSDDDMSEICNVDLIMISVPTPCKPDGRLDMSYIFGTLDTVAVLVRNNPNSTVVIRSTVTPGTVCEYKKALNDKLENQQVEVLFQPEFLRASSAFDDVMNPWYVVLSTHGGTDPPAALYDIYLDFTDESKIKIMSVEEAELLKIFHNSFNACKISFFNQCNLLCKEISKKNGSDIDVDTITNTLPHTCEGLKNAKYGTMTGHGYYGSCLPKDSSELKGLEAEYGLASKLFEEVVKVNDEVVSIDKKEKRGEILDGDFHKSPFALME